VILATPPHFRPEHLRYSVERGKHAFVEKPVAVDVPGVHAVMETCELARQKGLAVVSGLCWRYAPRVKETIARIQEGAIGDIVAIQSCYNTGTEWHRGENPAWSRMEYQIRNWLYYTWLSGDHIVEQAVHSLDKTAWLLGDASPVRAMGLGGRQQRTGPKFGNIYDHHTVFYEFSGGVRAYFTCRRQDNCSKLVEETVLGTKGKAWVLAGRIEGEKPWRYSGPKPSMFQLEHEELFKSIRAGRPINNGHYMTNSTLIAIMGRMCTYTGQDLTWEQVNGSQERLGPAAYEWGDVPEPPVPVPGVTKFA
jgi:predicted dehydrogenase